MNSAGPNSIEQPNVTNVSNSPRQVNKTSEPRFNTQARKRLSCVQLMSPTQYDLEGANDSFRKGWTVGNSHKFFWFYFVEIKGLHTSFPTTFQWEMYYICKQFRNETIPQSRGSHLGMRVNCDLSGTSGGQTLRLPIHSAAQRLFPELRLAL